VLFDPNKDECQLQLGYQGLLELVRRSGLVESIGCYLVHEKDVYEVNFGTNPGIKHEPYLDGDPGAVKFGYAVAQIKGGGRHVEVMTVQEINAIRDRSQNVRNAKKYNKQTPWDTDWDEMARKTLARRICKWLPKSNELAIALTLSDAADRDAQRLSIQDAIEGTFVAPPIDGETAETASAGDAVPHFDETSAIATLKAAKTLAELESAWTSIRKDFNDTQRELPVSIDATHHDRAEALKQ